LFFKHVYQNLLATKPDRAKASALTLAKVACVLQPSTTSRLRMACPLAASPDAP
jgi:hypothetical protein